MDDTEAATERDCVADAEIVELGDGESPVLSVPVGVALAIMLLVLLMVGVTEGDEPSVRDEVGDLVTEIVPVELGLLPMDKDDVGVTLMVTLTVFVMVGVTEGEAPVDSVVVGDRDSEIVADALGLLPMLNEAVGEKLTVTLFVLLIVGVTDGLAPRERVVVGDREKETVTLIDAVAPVLSVPVAEATLLVFEMVGVEDGEDPVDNEAVGVLDGVVEMVGVADADGGGAAVTDAAGDACRRRAAGKGSAWPGANCKRGGAAPAAPATLAARRRKGTTGISAQRDPGGLCGDWKSKQALQDAFATPWSRPGLRARAETRGFLSLSNTITFL